MPFNWTVNPYRGCTHACRYCFARPSHRYLELDQGLDFDQQIVVKTNVADVLRRELARPSWRGEQVALGTNTDPYQRAEGRYRLMPGIIEALAASGTPLSILTKGTLLRRDLGLLLSGRRGAVPVGIGVSLALGDEDTPRRLEPGVPSVRGRLDLIRAVREAGLPCGVMVAPVLPWLTDSAEQLDDLLANWPRPARPASPRWSCTYAPASRSGSWVACPGPPRPGQAATNDLYARGSNASPSFRNAFEAKVRPLLDKHGFGKAPATAPRPHDVVEAPGPGSTPAGAEPTHPLPSPHTPTPARTPPTRHLHPRPHHPPTALQPDHPCLPHWTLDSAVRVRIWGPWGR